MKTKTVAVYDTTLRDGAQGEGISLSVMDKLRICERLDDLGISYIEGGWPGSNPKDVEFFRQARKMNLKNAVMTAFSSTRRKNLKPSQDGNLKAILESGVRVAAIFGKSWKMHVRNVLRVSDDENLDMICETVAYLRKRGIRVIYDAEHFYDGYVDDPDYALKTLQAAVDGGCETIVLCDTNGGTITSEISAATREMCSLFNLCLGIHTHNDGGMAVANTVAGVEAGCRHVQGTVNGYGERCGNADLMTVIPSLELKTGMKCLPAGGTKKLLEVSRYVSEIANMKAPDNQPYVGQSAFAHKGGMHVNAVLKNPRTFEHVQPEIVGNKRRFLVSELSGKSSIIVKARKMGLDLGCDGARVDEILKGLKALEYEGYQFEAADASLELLLRRKLGKGRSFFDLEGFRVIVEKRNGRLVSEATIKIRVKSVLEHTAAEGDGPVNALDSALRKALEGFYPSLRRMRLIDYKVRVLEERAGTAARVRVLIESQDEKDTWFTVGVSENIIQASWEALVDSVEYKLLKDERKKR